MKQKTYPYFSIILILISITALMLSSKQAVESAKQGLYICANVIVPSLLPFFVLTSLLSVLGFPQLIAKWSGPFMRKAFGLSGQCCAPLILGLTGSYPVGAVTTVELYKNGLITKNEAQRLLPFCNNSGPAFIIGAAGVGIFRSSAAGLLLYLCHIAAALLVGVIFCSKKSESAKSAPLDCYQVQSLPQALAGSVKGAVTSTITICGFVVFFSVITGLLSYVGLFTSVAGHISEYLGFELSFSQSLLTGILELGSGIGSMYGLKTTPVNLALASFILGFGGLSVHCQTLAVLDGTGIKSTLHFAGRILHGLISAALVFVISSLLMGAF